MRAVVVEVGAPGRDQNASMAQAIEQVLVQAFVAHPAVKAFHEPVLHWLSRRDVMPVNLAVFLPFQDGIAGEFGPIIADDHTWIAAHLSDPVQFMRDTVTRQRRIDHSSKAFPAKVVDHIENAEPPTTRQAVRHEVEAPPLVRPLGDRHRRPGAHCALATAALTNS